MVVYSADHEPHARNPSARTGAPGEPAKHGEDQRHVDFFADADLVIHDAQYTRRSTRRKRGWGHTPAEWAVDYAVAARVKRLALFHHDPLRGTTGRWIGPWRICRRRAGAAGSALQVFAAAEGQDVTLLERRPRRHLRRAAGPACRGAETWKAGPHTILVADDDPVMIRASDPRPSSRTASGW